MNVVIIFLSIFFFSCSTDPEPIEYGKDQCEHCRMKIMDNKFGAEIVTNKGKIFKFDATECMLGYVSYGKLKQEDIANYYTTDASKPGQLIDASKAAFLISPKFPSPMGADLSAYANKSDAEKYQKDFTGEIKSWNDLLVQFKVK